MREYRQKRGWHIAVIAALLSAVIPLGGISLAGGRAWKQPDVFRPTPSAPLSLPAVAPAAVLPVIEDPQGDHTGSTPTVDIIQVLGGSESGNVTLRIVFSPDTDMGQVVGFIDLDTDQDPGTGLPPVANLLLGTEQDIGADFTLSLFGLPSGEPILIVNNITGELAGEVPGVISGQSLEITMPLSVLGSDDGNIDIGMVLGNPGQPTDAAPDEGHGTIGVPRRGGTSIGILLENVLCINTTNPQIVSIQQPGKSWNCAAAGLRVQPGDKVHQILSGTAE